jgi:alginate O-acetyltransferase complex protein AlgJ
VSEDIRTEHPDLPASIRDGKVVEGLEGRLFLANDANSVLDQHSGRLRFSEDQLRQWRVLLETRTAWLERLGSHHFFLIAPNAHSVYPHMLPAGVPSAPERPVHQLLGHLRDNESYARVVYPLDALASGDDLVYPKTGTHWSELGASIACRTLVEEIRREVPIDPLSPHAFEFMALPFNGDLGAKMTPPWVSTYVRADVRTTRARRVADNRVRNTGRRMDYEWTSGAGGPSCLVYGDSFAIRVLQFLAESFPRLTFVHMMNLDFDLVRSLAPDVVVKIMNERFLISVPVDAPAKTQAQLEAERIAAGDVMPPRQVPPAPRGRPLSQIR